MAKTDMTDMLEKYYNNINVYEWKNLWSKCFGKILLINGTSSSGKTTLCGKMSKFGFNPVNIDIIADEMILDFFGKFTNEIFVVKSFLMDTDMTKILRGYKVKEQKYTADQYKTIESIQKEINSILEHNETPSKIEMYTRVYESAKEYIFSGQNVVIDISAKKSSLEMLSYCFNYYPMETALLYSPLEENLIKCFYRNFTSYMNDTMDYRYPAMVIDQYNMFYRFLPKSEISQKDKIIGVLDKDIVCRILELSKEFNLALFYHSQEVRYSKMGYFSIEMDFAQAAKLMENIVRRIKDNMMLESDEEVYISPKVECNYVFNIQVDGNEYQELIGNIKLLENFE